MKGKTDILRIISLRPEETNNEFFEIMLRKAGHRVTVLSSTEPAFALVNSSWPDVVLFDPISQFGMSGSIQRLLSGFDGVIIATGHIPDPTISAMLEELGVVKFAATASDLLRILKNATNRNVYTDVGSVGVVENEPDASVPVVKSDRQLELAVTGSESLEKLSASSNSAESQAEIPLEDSINDNFRRSLPTLNMQSIGNFKFNLQLKRWRRTAIGMAMVAAVISAVAIPFFGRQPVSEPENDAQALSVIPRLLTEPLAPLTLEELSGETLPLEIAGIKDRAVIEKPAIAFWGDTAPDAFVTVNGKPVEVSKYGAFVVDYPLDDGANFIEILASDFQGRTTRQTFTIVSLQ